MHTPSLGFVLSLIILSASNVSGVRRITKLNGKMDSDINRGIDVTAGISRSTGNNMADLVPRTVQLPLGKVTGISCSTDMTVTKYLGIPFAETPVEKNRFKPPLSYSTPYPVGGLQATKNPPPCGSLCQGSVRDTTESAEDCLFLNIWVPASTSLRGEKVPVRVFIHGGDLMECSASDAQWDGCQVASKENIIHVNIQFRLGPFGMFSHPLTLMESNTTGNWGILDQQMALQWIQDNIHYFGGDPTKVVLTGHSRGAQMVDFQMVSPGSTGLFRAAISQSAPCSHLRTLEQGYNDTRLFMETVQCAPLESTEAELACMRELPWEYLFNISREMVTGRALDILWCDQLNWHPVFHHVVDGTVLPLQLIDALKSGQFNKVPYMVGHTTEEAGAMASLSYIDDITGKDVDNFIKVMYPNADPETIKAFYNIEHFQNASDPVTAQLSEIWSDTLFTCPIHERLAARSRHGDTSTYFYWWGVTPSCPPESVEMGPSHGTDLWFTFAQTDGFETSVTPSGTCSFNPAEIDVSQHFVFAHHSMAATGTPSWPNGTHLVKYDPYIQYSNYVNTAQFLAEVVRFDDRCTILNQAKQL